MTRLLNASNDSQDFGAQFLTLLLSAVEDEEFGPPYLALIRDIGTNNNVRDLFLEFHRNRDAAGDCRLDSHRSLCSGASAWCAARFWAL